MLDKYMYQDRKVCLMITLLSFILMSPDFIRSCEASGLAENKPYENVVEKWRLWNGPILGLKPLAYLYSIALMNCVH